jgi:hypothetical protein
MSAMWTAEIMTDPMRDHRLHVELLEDGHFRARLYEDDSGRFALRVYAGDEAIIPTDWFFAITQKFKENIERPRRQGN